jgi:hypothetical protein
MRIGALPLIALLYLPQYQLPPHYFSLVACLLLIELYIDKIFLAYDKIINRNSYNINSCKRLTI